MAKTVTVYYKKAAPFVGVNVPGAQPSVVIMRGESAVLDKKLADDFRARLKAGKIIDLTEDHFEFVAAAEAEAAPEPTKKLGAIEDRTVADKLVAAGFDTPEKVRAASDDDLDAVSGIGPASISQIRAAYPVETPPEGEAGTGTQNPPGQEEE